MVENAGKFNKQIVIVEPNGTHDAAGFNNSEPREVLKTWASVKTTKGYTLIANGSDFEKATTNFTIRYPLTTITRDMLVLFKGKVYEIQYLNNVNEANIELEIQAKEVTH